MVVEHVILDAGAVIASSDLPSLGQQFHSTQAVMSEVKDQNARLRLQLLPSPVEVRDPAPAHVQRVLSMAKTSGDIGVLSAADVGIVALALQVMEELGCPAQPPAEAADVDDAEAAASASVNEQAVEESDEDEESGWVTKDNLSSVLGNGGAVTTKDELATVACASTDFAVQNVCAKLGVPILACDGRLIAEIRTYVLWCAGCFKRCLRQDKRFCPSCGHATLQRVSAQLDNATGQIKLFFKRNYQYRLKGTRYSLPQPRGGKHSLDPVVSEWQRVPQQRPTKKALRRANPLAEADGAVPGAACFPDHDLTSRAAVLGVRGGPPQWSRRNPNEPGPRTGNGRRKKRRV